MPVRYKVKDYMDDPEGTAAPSQVSLANFGLWLSVIA